MTVANELNSDIIVSKFKFKKANYIHFQTSTLKTKYEPLIPQTMN